jgi:hypothetical protein
MLLSRPYNAARLNRRYEPIYHRVGSCAKGGSMQFPLERHLTVKLVSQLQERNLS